MQPNADAWKVVYTMAGEGTDDAPSDSQSGSSSKKIPELTPLSYWLGGHWYGHPVGVCAGDKFQSKTAAMSSAPGAIAKTI